ncbi:conserved hypothetical protein [Xanthomonas oryzae pv. oryzae KACC 10331]|uniref:Uncharacterized protein n=1 Tax=Xanthomonas oryzae pv. oryzae (strain KACC10331 / KXO85) TaxID=291331 RepID=Q5H5E5_XANOR|nr:conserved hypothetical protein [Xanthomonas oryzae pv. oryzae KACC 10331]
MQACANAVPSESRLRQRAPPTTRQPDLAQVTAFDRAPPHGLRKLFDCTARRVLPRLRAKRAQPDAHAVEEVFESFWHLDGRIFRTLRDLLVPGRLALRLLSGQRRADAAVADPEPVDVLHRAHRRARVRRRQRYRHAARYQPDCCAQGFRARTHADTGGSAAQSTGRDADADAHRGADRHRTRQRGRRHCAHQCRSAQALGAIASRCAPDQRRAHRGGRQRQHVLCGDGQAVGPGEQPVALRGATAIRQPLDQHATQPYPRQRAAPAQQSAAAPSRVLRRSAVCVAGAGAAVCAAVTRVLCAQRAGVSGASGGGVVWTGAVGPDGVDAGVSAVDAAMRVCAVLASDRAHVHRPERRVPGVRDGCRRAVDGGEPGASLLRCRCGCD